MWICSVFAWKAPAKPFPTGRKDVQKQMNSYYTNNKKRNSANDLTPSPQPHFWTLLQSTCKWRNIIFQLFLTNMLSLVAILCGGGFTFVPRYCPLVCCCCCCWAGLWVTLWAMPIGKMWRIGWVQLHCHVNLKGRSNENFVLLTPIAWVQS